MKKFLTFLTAVAFASVSLFAEAASPRAAEDPSASVISTGEPAPKVKAPVAAKKHKKHVKKAGLKKTGFKKVAAKKHGKTFKGKKRKIRAHRY